MGEMKPFVSISIIVATLFGLVFFKMEVRRVGYSVLKLVREERVLRDKQREQKLQLAKILRPGRLQSVATTRLTLKKAASGQIIQMTDQGIGIRQ
jgi:hypothetical protein